MVIFSISSSTQLECKLFECSVHWCIPKPSTGIAILIFKSSFVHPTLLRYKLLSTLNKLQQTLTNSRQLIMDKQRSGPLPLTVYLAVSTSQGRPAQSDVGTVWASPTEVPEFPSFPLQEWWQDIPIEDLSALASSASHWVTWKPPLSLLSQVSIFNLEEKKITALFFGCIKIYGAGWFPGCCSWRALLQWCMTATCHQCSQALMIHCSNKSFVIHHCLSSCPHPGLSCTVQQGALARNKLRVPAALPEHHSHRAYCSWEGRKGAFSSKLYRSVLRLLKVKGSYTLMPEATSK